MSVEYVNCNHCGTRLEVAPSTNFVTCSQCGTSLAVKRTTTSLFTEPAGSAPVAPPPMHSNVPNVQEQLSELRRETELARLDRDWDRQREDFMMTTKYGRRYQPNVGMSIFTGVVAVVGGTIWMVFAFSISGDMGGPASIFPLFGIVFILFGLGMSIYMYSKATQYQQANDAYRRRRAKLLSEQFEDSEPAENAPQFQTSEEEEGDEESAACLRCGASIPAFRKACPQCGWSYGKS